MRLARLEYKWVVGLIFVVGLFMDLLDITITNVAIPTLSRDFQANTTTIEWVITGYLLSLAVIIPISGWLGDRFGTKVTFVAALSIFIAASLLCGLAWDIESLIAFRVLQGIGGGMLTPVGTTMLFRAFPPSERAAASALLAVPVTVAPALGPILGGYLVEYQDWSWIFWVNIPIGLIGLAAAIVFLREERMPNAGKLDIPGFVLGTAGLVSAVYALAEAGQHGFDDTRVLLFGLGGLALLAAFVVVELGTREPMLDVRLLTDRLFGASNLVQLMGMGPQMGAFFVLPLLLQAEKGLSPLEAGLTTFPMAIGVALLSQPAAKLYGVIGPRRMMVFGFTGAMFMTFALAFIDYGTSDWLIGLNMLVRGMFMAFVFIPMQAVAFATIRPQDTGRASSIFSAGRQVSSSLGVALLATVLTSRLAHYDAVLGNPVLRDAALPAFQDVFIVAGLLGALGVAAAFLIDDRRAAHAAGQTHAGEHVPEEPAMRAAVEATD